MASGPTCRLCRSPIRSWEQTARAGICKPCDIALFQLEDALEQYVQGGAPSWLRKAMPHFSWVFDSYPLAAAYLNLSMEVLFEFVVEEAPILDDETLQELRFMRVSPQTVKSVLVRAGLIRESSEGILPGSLTAELSKLRLSDYDLGTPEFIEKVSEIRGVVCFALTLALVDDANFVPQRPLSPLRALGLHILETDLNNEDALNHLLPDRIFNEACRMVSDRQFRKMKWYMAGFATGRPYLIKGIRTHGEDEGLVLHDDVVMYAENVRTRYRERLRERARG